LTICAWFNTVSSSDGVIVRKSGYEWLLYKTASSIVSFYIDEDGVSAWSAYISGSSIVNDGSWHHSCGVYDGVSDLKFYFDGVSEGTIGGTEPANLYSSNDVWSIGGYLGTTNFFAGSIDDIMIYNKALSEEEVLIIYEVQGK